MLHILSLKDDSHNHVKLDTFCKDGQPLHRLSNSTLFDKCIQMNIHTHPSNLIAHVVRMNNAHNINLIMIRCAYG